MSLHRLIFDPANSAESANVGAYLRDAAGALMTSTLVGSNQALDVNLVQSVSLTVTATALDIRHLAPATDEVKIGDGTNTLAVNADGSINAVVTATALDIRHLAAATDSVAAWAFDGAGTALTSTLVSGKQGLDVNLINATSLDDALANAALAVEADSITTTSGAAIATPLSGRKYVSLYNNGSKIIYIGPSGVTTAAGFPLFPGSLLEARIGSAVAIHAVAQSGTQELRVMQAS